jgi:hypothetical protein
MSRKQMKQETKQMKNDKTNQQKFLDFIKIDFDKLISLDEVLTTLSEPKKLKNMKEWDLKTKVDRNKKTLTFYDGKTLLLYHTRSDGRIIKDDDYENYTFSKFFDLKSLSSSSFKLTKNNGEDSLGHLLLDLQIMKIKLKELGVVDYTLSICSNIDLDFKDTYNCYVNFDDEGDDEEDQYDGCNCNNCVDSRGYRFEKKSKRSRPFLYTKIKFANKADAAIFLFTYHSTVK